MNKTFFFFFFLVLLLNFVSAEIETQPANKLINLTFTCTLNNAIPSASANFNITINKVGGEILVYNKATIPLGQGSFYYPINFGNVFGTYEVQEFCYDGVYSYSNTDTIEVTAYGKSGNTNLVFYIFIALVLYAIGFIGFFGKNVYISALGGLGLIAFGLYSIREGLIIYQDWITNLFSYITIGIGAIFALVALVEYIEEM